MIPVGKCQCGCGGDTKISPATVARWGYVKGVPRHFIWGHHNRLPKYQRKALPNPITKTLICSCGCGQEVKPTKHDRVAWRKGQPPEKRFIKGHDKRKSPVEYVVEDRGFITPCWIWKRAKTGLGYGAITINHKLLLAHRVYYERAKGSIPGGLQLDHLCFQKDCVCPDHLEAVTCAINMQRRRPHMCSNGRVTWLSRGKQSTP